MDKEPVPDDPIELPHHHQSEFCRTRPAYRQGRRLTAVKAYTINSESTHLLIFGVPKINLRQELKSLLQKYGKIKYLLVSPNYPSEEFTECFHVNFENLQSARKAKKSVDMRSFYGSVLHICYAPELEICQETKEKLNQRRIYIKKCLFRIKRDNEFNKKNLTQNSNMTNHQELQTNHQTDNFSSNRTAHICQIICPVIPQPESHIMLYSQSLIATSDKVGMYNSNNHSNINDKYDTFQDLSETSSSTMPQLKRPLDTKEYVFKKKKRKKKSTNSINEAIKSATMKLNTLQNSTEKSNESSANMLDVLESKNLNNLQAKCVTQQSTSEDFVNKSEVLELKTLNNPQVKSIPKKSTNKIIMRINTKLI